jgi:hypothetical protein
MGRFDFGAREVVGAVLASFGCKLGAVFRTAAKCLIQSVGLFCLEVILGLE